MPLPDHVTTEELAGLLGLSGRRIRQLADEGVLPKADRNQFPLSESLKAFQKHREKEIRAEYEKENTAAAEYERERARLTGFKAGMAEIEYDLLRGTSHDGAAVVFYMGQMIANFRARVLAIPNSCAGVVANLSDAEACRAVIDERCREAAEELSDYDPAAVVGKTRADLAAKKAMEQEEAAG